MAPFTENLPPSPALLLRDNIDTDAIIPSREIRSVSKTGLTQGLFAAWRYLPGQGAMPDPEFILNDPAYEGAQILLSGRQFRLRVKSGSTRSGRSRNTAFAR